MKIWCFGKKSQTTETDTPLERIRKTQIDQPAQKTNSFLSKSKKYNQEDELRAGGFGLSMSNDRWYLTLPNNQGTVICAAARGSFYPLNGTIYTAAYRMTLQNGKVYDFLDQGMPKKEGVTIGETSFKYIPSRFDSSDTRKKFFEENPHLEPIFNAINPHLPEDDKRQSEAASKRMRLTSSITPAAAASSKSLEQRNEMDIFSAKSRKSTLPPQVVVNLNAVAKSELASPKLEPFEQISANDMWHINLPNDLGMVMCHAARGKFHPVDGIVYTPAIRVRFEGKETWDELLNKDGTPKKEGVVLGATAFKYIPGRFDSDEFKQKFFKENPALRDVARSLNLS